MFIILIVVMVSWVTYYVKTYQTVHFKYVQLDVCCLYVNKAGRRGRGRGKRRRQGSSKQEESFWEAWHMHGPGHRHTDVHALSMKLPLGLQGSPKSLSTQDSICEKHQGYLPFAHYSSRVLPVCLACAGHWGFRDKSNTGLALGSSCYWSWRSLPKIQPKHLASCPKYTSQVPFTGSMRTLLLGPNFVSSLATSWEKARNSIRILSCICAKQTSKLNPN